MASLAPFEGVLGPRLAKHLLRRATFNISQQRIDEFELYTVDQALGVLLTPSQKKSKSTNPLRQWGFNPTKALDQ